MVVEETITIKADADTVWRTFTDLSCWKDWSRVMTDVTPPGSGLIEEGSKFSFCIRPFAVPIYIEPVVEEVVPGKRIIWSGAKLGVTALHEFTFESHARGVRVTSRERFKGFTGSFLLFMATKWRLRQLSADVLMELKSAAEAVAPSPSP